MNKKITVPLLALFMCAGIIMTSYTRFEQDKEVRNRAIRKDGRQLVKMIGLAYEGAGLDGDKKYFLRELSLVAANPKIAYVILHDRAKSDQPAVILPSPDTVQMIPEKIRTAALYGTGFRMQKYLGSDKNAYVELSQPVYRRGEAAAVVRLGMNQDRSRFLEWANLMFPLQVFFFIGMGLVCMYYWFTLMLKPFRDFERQGLLRPAGPRPDPGNVGAMIQRMEGLVTELHGRTRNMEKENRELSTHVKIIEYENNQMFHIFNSLDFGILMFDMKENLFFINDYFLDLLEKKREEVLNRTVFDGLDHEDLDAFIRGLSLMEDSGRGRQAVVSFPGTRPGRWYLVSSSLLMDPESLVFGRMIRLTDVTREKTTEKAQQDFVNHIAHELRTPLTNIKAYNEMIMEGEVTDLEMQKEFFNTINDETNRLSELIRNILKLAETEMGQVTVKKEMVKTKWLVQSSLAAVEAVAKDKQIRLDTRLPDNLPKISGDKEMLKAALINVLGNAVKYTPEQGRVVFSLKDRGDKVIFEVADSGFGIDPTDLPRVFEKFYRSDKDEITAETGSGLGLAITAEIVKTHDGEIEVESDTGRGSTFTITIPKGELKIG